MDQLYKDPRTPLRMREGPLGAYVDAFAQQLIDEGYARASARYALQLVADLGRWLRRRRVVAAQLAPEHIARYLEHRSRQGHHRSGDAAILRRLMRLLLEQGIVAQGPSIESTQAERLEDEFRLYWNASAGSRRQRCSTIWCISNASSRTTSPMEKCGSMRYVRPMWWVLCNGKQIGFITPSAPS